MVLAVFPNTPLPDRYPDSGSGLGHIGHIEGIFQDLFTYRKYEKSFRKMGEKCPKCPKRVKWTQKFKKGKNC